MVAGLNRLARLAFDPEGTLYIADFGNTRLRRVRPVFPALAAGTQVVPSADGAALYLFDARGTHQVTRDARTGVTLLRFAYDAAGRLVRVRDRAGLEMVVERDAAGTPTALVAPGGQRTALTVGPDGYLATVANPAGETTTLAYHAGGLLASLTDAKQQMAAYTYL